MDGTSPSTVGSASHDSGTVESGITGTETTGAVDTPAAAEPAVADAATAGAARGRWYRLRQPVPDRAVTVGELAVLLGALVIAMLSVASLAMAHLAIFSLFHAALGTAVLLILLAAVARFTGPLPRVVLDLPGLVTLAAVAILALWMFLPGFHYAAGDRDPGGYMMTGAVIAREHSVTFTAPQLAAHLPVQTYSPGALFPGLWITNLDAGTVTPQFYHLWPALLAVSYSLHGFAGMANTDPFVAVLAVLLAVALARRVAGPVAAVLAGVLLSVQMLQVWQAKYPTAEMLTQMLFLAALLGLAMSVQTGWRWPAFVAGLMVSTGWLARADGLLLVLLAVGGVATLYVLRQLDRRGWWFVAGMTALAPYALYQAYGPAALYTRDNKVPGMAVVLGVIGGCALLAVVLRPLLTPLARLVGTATSSPRGQRRIGAAVVVACGGLFTLGVIRPVFGEDYTHYGRRIIRSYDEQSLHRLSWFFTWPGLLLMLAGIAFVALRRWRPAPWLVVISLLAFLPVYAWHAHNSTYLMWWGRRFVSTVVPGMVLLIAVALAGLWLLRGRLRLLSRLTAVAMAGFLAVIFLGQSLPVRHHDEWGGTYFVERDLADLAGDSSGVFLWQKASYCCAAPQMLLASPLWLIQDQLSVLLPVDSAKVPGYVSDYVDHFSDRPVFLVLEKGEPPSIPGMRVELVREFSGGFPRWDESSVYRPSQEIQIPYRFSVYRVTRSG